MKFVRTDAHVNCLDGLRGLAALWVVLSHAQILTGMRDIPVLSWGGVAVDLFMMLSGFLMTHHYILRREAEPWDSPRTAITFWCRRYFRIAPLYYVLLVIALVLGPRIGDYRNAIAAVWPTTATTPERYLDQSLPNIATHVSFLFGALPEFSFRTPLPDWSIGLEMQFYLAFPLLMLMIARIGPLAMTILVLAICFAVKLIAPEFVAHFEMPSLLPLKLHVFLIGMWLAIGRNTERKRSSLAIALVLSLLAYATDSKLMTLCQTTIALMVFVLVDDLPLLTASPINKVITAMRRLFTSRFAIFLGDSSYAVYLLHLLILIPVSGMLAAQARYVALNQYVRFALVLAIVLPIVYLLASQLYRYLEKPGIRLGKKILQGLVATKPQTASTVLEKMR